MELLTCRKRDEPYRQADENLLVERSVEDVRLELDGEERHQSYGQYGEICSLRTVSIPCGSTD